MMGSFVLCSMAIGLVYGTYGKVINTFTKGHAGHMQIHAKSFLERPSLFKNFRDTDELDQTLANDKRIIGFSPRVMSSVLISSGEKTTGGRLIGINPETEAKTTTIHQKVSEGAFLQNETTNNIVLGHALAKILDAKVGTSLVLMTQGADGSMSNDSFMLVGILSEESDSMEGRNAYVEIQVARDFLVLGSRTHEYVVSFSNYDEAYEISDEYQAKFKDLEVSPWQEIESEFYKAMKADQTGIWINLGILIFIVSIGVLNTVLMTILERTREFGILKAIGTRPKDIFIMVVLETAVLSLVSVFIGVFIASFINYRLSLIGIPYPMPIEIGGMALHHLYSELNFFNLWVPALVVTLSSVGISIFPAIRASQIVPVKAIRST